MRAVLLAFISTLVATACADDKLISERPVEVSSKEERYGQAAQPISIPSGVYKYCSAQKGSGWYVVADPANNNPCTTALAALGSGAVIKRAGFVER